MRRELSALLVPTLVVAVIVAGCGGDDGSTATEGSGSSPQSRQDEIREFGSEASSPEAQQAEVALKGYLDARAVGEWKKACSYLARNVRRGLGQLAAKSKQVQGKDCAGLIEASTKSLSSSERADLGQVDVNAVRVEGEQGFVLYKDAADAEYAMPMKSERGQWKVAGVGGLPLK